MGTLLERYSQAIIIALAAVLAGALAVIALEQRDGPGPLEVVSTAPTPPGPVEVYIAGAVNQPGVYEIADGERVIDVLYKAGGPAPDANLEAINLAVRLHDEDHVIVPRIGQAVGGAGVSSSVAAVTSSGLMNINTASAAELDGLPGIGEVYSQRIVESRTNEGLFATIDDLLNREIIPSGTFEKIRELITAGP